MRHKAFVDININQLTGVGPMSRIRRVVDAALDDAEASNKKQFIRSLEETAARAIVTATVTFAVGWVLKKMFEKSVAEAAQSGVEDHLSSDG